MSAILRLLTWNLLVRRLTGPWAPGIDQCFVSVEHALLSGLKNIFSVFYFFILCVIGRCAVACMWTEDSWPESVLSSHYVQPGDWAVLRRGGGTFTCRTIFVLSRLRAHACPFFSWVLGYGHSGPYAFKATLLQLRALCSPYSPSPKSAVKRHWEAFIKINDEISFYLIIIHNFIKGSYLIKTMLSDRGWVSHLCAKSSHGWSYNDMRKNKPLTGVTHRTVCISPPPQMARAQEYLLSRWFLLKWN